MSTYDDYDKNGFLVGDTSLYFDAERGEWVWEETLISDEHLAAEKREIEAADRDFLRKVGIEIESPSDN